MAIGSGLGGSVGVAPETTFGTYVAPTRFYEPKDNFEVKKVKNTVQGGGLAAGRIGRPAARRIVTTEAGTGSGNFEVTKTGMGLLLNQIFGGTVTPAQQGATTAYLSTFALSDNFGRSLTAQNGVPDTTGVVRPYTGLGGKVTSAEFSCGVDEELMVALEIDFRQVSEAQTLAAPSYVARMPWSFREMSVRVGATPGTEAAVVGIKKATWKIERAQDTSRFYAGANGLKAEPIMNDFAVVSGSFDFDFTDKTVFADRFSADTQASIVISFVGGVIAGGNNETIDFTFPASFFDGETPSLSGPGVVMNSVPFVALQDATNPMVTCRTISTDTSL